MRTAALVALLVLLGAGCGHRQPYPLGRLREVTAVSRQWELVRPVVESILGREVQTPQPEREFRLKVGSYDRAGGYSRMRILFLLGTLDDTVISGILAGRAESLPGGGHGLFKLPNAWAGNQTVLVLAARDDSALLAGLRLYAGRVRQVLLDVVLEQMVEATYYQPADRAKSSELGRKYGFTLDVPASWLLETRQDTARFVYVYGHAPDRSLFVYWSDTAPALLTDSLVALRNRLTSAFYDGDRVHEGVQVAAESIGFMGGPCLRLRGVWQNPGEVIGGPFVSYSFSYQGRFFMLDGTLFNPGERKLDNLFQLEAVIRTFTPR